VLAERLAHTLRSVAANIGAEEVSSHAQALEHALRSGQEAGAAAALLGAVDSALQPLLDGLQAWMQRHRPAAPDSVAGAGAGHEGLDGAGALQHLRGLLEQDDPAAPEFFQHNAPVLKPVLGSAFTVVEMHTLNFDFEQALGAMADAPGSEHPAAHTP